MKYKKTVVFFIAILLFVMPHIAWTCTTFNIHGEDYNLLGHNYDWHIENGLLMINKRGLAKVAVLASIDEENFTGQPARWTSKYGSVTFNQYGRELLHGGMNEAGLVVESMALRSTVYPEPDSRPFIHRSQWSQYLLDNYKSIEEVINSFSIIRISPIYSGPGTHFLLSDRTGNSAIIEFVNGKRIVYTGAQIPVKVLANDTYAESMQIWKNNDGIVYRNRFVQAATRIQNFKYQSLGTAIETTFDILDEVSQGMYTKWSVVFDIKNSTIHYRTFSNPSIRYLDLKKIDFSCRTPTQVLDINGVKAGDITNRFVDYSFQKNRNLIQESVERSSFIRGSKKPGFVEYLNKLARYPDSAVCQAK